MSPLHIEITLELLRLERSAMVRVRERIASQCRGLDYPAERDTHFRSNPSSWQDCERSAQEG